MPAFKPRHRSLLFGLALLYQAPVGAQLPSGGKVVDGSATIGAPSGNQQVITQTSQRAIIDWLNFSIGSGQGVHFKQPGASAIILNRVTGNTPSNIFGSLSADGQVFLVNPAGVFFGAGSSVDVAGLMATTLDIDKDDFMAGRYTFSRSEGLSAARREVINEGLLKAREGGYIVLAGDYAANRGEGIIQARLGTVALAAGAQMTLDIAGDSLINFAVDEKTVAELSGVENSGTLLADGGRAIMTAAVARDLATAAVNNSGLVQAQTAEEREGVIYLSAGEGNALVSGTLDASGKATGQKGGTIEVVGDKVALVEDAVLDASGAAGGGRINVGGSFQGKGPLPNSRTAFVGQDVELKADALENGNGGEVVIWSDDYTRFYGHASSRGGAQGGDGGQVEVSGKAILDYNGSVNTLAAKGKAGNLLLDPSDIEILNSIDPATADMTGSSPFQDASNNGGVSRMTVGALEAALASGNVTVTTNSSGGSAGNITIDDGGGGGVQWSSGSTLRLQADNHIYIKSNVQGGNGTLWLDAVNGATQSANTNITANSLLLTGGGSWDLAGVGSSNQINSYNDVNNFAADINGGLLRFSSNKSFTVGTVNGVNGIDHTNGNTQLYLDRNNGKLTLAQNLNSGSIYIRAGGGVSQTGGSVTANNLALVGGAASLTRSGNDVNTLAASLNGSLAYTEADSLEIGSVFGVNGITTNNNNVTLRTGNASGFDASQQPSSTNPASLTLNQSVNAGSGTISLTVGNGGVYQRRDVANNGDPMPEGSLLANALVLRSNSTSSVTPFVLSNANNLVGTLAASVNGSVSYTGGPLTVGTVDGVTGIRTTANTIVVPAGVDASNRPTPAIYNDNSVSLSVGGNFWINENIDTTTSTGSGSVSLGLGGDFLAMTAPGKRINANTLSVFGDDMVGTFYLRTYTPTLAAGGGKIMVIDNSDYTGELTALGIGAPASNTSVTGNGSTVDVTSSAKPVGDFYLTTGGGLNIIKLLSKGKNLLLRADSLDILLDATTADGARIMLQPYHLNRRVGIHNDSDRDFNAQTNYSADMLLKFTNPTATFYIGTPQNALLQDPDVQLAAKNALTGDIHIGSDGDFNLGYRSLSAQTSGSIVAHSVGPLYNLRLQAPNLTIHGFETFGNQIHLITNHLSLPGTTANYVNGNRPDIMIRSMDDNTVWIGNGLSNKPYEPNFLSSTLAKLPDYSTIIISGSTDHPFPNGGSGFGDIHIPWDDGLGVALGNRKLVLSTGNKIYTYTRTPAYTKRDDGGTSGGLWQGCQDLTTCMGSNPNPYPDPDGSGGGSDGDNSGDGDGDSSSNTDPSDCASCPPAPPNDNPYPPDTPDPGTDTPGTGNTGNGDSSAGDGTSDSGDGGGDNGAGTDGGGTGDSGTGDGTGGAGDGDGGSGTGTDGAGDGTGGAGDGNDSGGDGGAGTGGGGAGDGTGDDGAGDGAGGAGDGDGGAGDGSDGNGDGTGGAGDGSDGGGDSGAGTGGGGAGDGDGGDGAGDGDAGNGDSGAGDGSGADGAGDGGDGGGDDGAGTGSGGTGDGDASAGDGDTGNGNGDDGTGDGSGGASNGDGGDGDGDGGAGTDSGGSGEGDTGAGTGAEDSGDNDDGNSGDGDGEDGGGDAGTTTDSGGSQDGDGSSDSGGADGSDGSGNTDDGNGTGDGKGDDDGDAGSTTDSGSTGENGNDGNDAEGDGDDGSNGGAAPAVTLDCQDVSPERQQEPDATGQRSNRDLIEVKQDGVKMHDPCKQQPAGEDQ